MTVSELETEVSRRGPYVQKAIAAFLQASGKKQKIVTAILHNEISDQQIRQLFAVVSGGDPVISKARAARLLGLSVATIHRYIKQGKLKTINGHLTMSIVYAFNKGEENE